MNPDFSGFFYFLKSTCYVVIINKKQLFFWKLENVKYICNPNKIEIIFLHIYKVKQTLKTNIMEFKPNEVTPAEAKEIVQKFKDYGKGVVVGNSKYLTSHNWDDISAKWSDLMDEQKFSINAIKQKMIEIYRDMRNLPEDTMLGDVSVAFTHTTERGKRIQFKYSDMYVFLREALRERKETADYKKKSKKLAEAKAYIDANKSQDEKLKEMQALAAQLENELGETDSPETPVAAASNSVA